MSNCLRDITRASIDIRSQHRSTFETKRSRDLVGSLFPNDLSSRPNDPRPRRHLMEYFAGGLDGDGVGIVLLILRRNLALT